MIAVVLGHNYTSRLGMIRAVGSAGCQVDVFATFINKPKNKKSQIDFYSKYVNSYECFSIKDPEILIKRLIEKYDKKKFVFLLPTDDFCASLIDSHLDCLKDSFIIPNIDNKQGEINRLMDKDYQKALANLVGLPTAKGWTVKIDDGHYSIPGDIEYPCFTKPQISLKGGKGEFMQICNDENELDIVLRNISKKAKNCPMLIEQYIPIEKEYATLGVRNGNLFILPYMLHLKEQGHGNHRGVALSGDIIPIEQFRSIEEKIHLLMDKIGFTGLFDVDLYEHNNIIYFNELNLRFGASGYAVTRMGVNLPFEYIHSFTPEELHLTRQTREDDVKTYLNEKVNFDSYINGFISLEQYKQQQQPDITFIQSREDKKPYFIFTIWTYYMRLKRIITKKSRT